MAQTLTFRVEAVPDARFCLSGSSRQIERPVIVAMRPMRMVEMA
jgi:hypothetical protein